MLFNIFKKNKYNKLNNEIQKYQNLNKQLNHYLKQLNLRNPKLINQYFKNYIDLIDNDLKIELTNKIENYKQELETQSRNILWEAISNLDVDSYKVDYLYTVKCKNNEKKSRLIGANGRNKKAFEKVTGAELIIHENIDEIKISSKFNLEKKEMARLLLDKLLITNNIEPNKIKNYYEEIKNEFNQNLKFEGEKILKEKLKIFDLPTDSYWYVGKMKYRMSYGQNLLEHSIESAYMARNIAKVLNLNTKLAMKCAFLHDIGKVISYDHVEAGVKLATEWELDPIIINAIESHHGKTFCESLYASITKFVDKVSASRIGARINTTNDHHDRVMKYESICHKFKEVKDCWTINSGYCVKVVIRPNLIKKYEDLDILAKRIQREFYDQKLYNVTIELINENSVTIKTDDK